MEVRTGGNWAAVGALKWRALLAALVTKPGQVISTERLIDELWGNDAPQGARKLVSGYVLRIRRLAGDADGRLLVTQAPGYRVMMSRADIDACQFEDLLRAGRKAFESNAGRAADLLTEALSLWRGPALMDIPRAPLAATEADRLEELRLSAEELRIEASIGCGRQTELVPELRSLTSGHPLREQFWHQLMRVLTACGRPAEALEIYAHVRDILADALGADPGPELQQLHQRILVGGPGLLPLAASQVTASVVMGSPDRDTGTAWQDESRAGREVMSQSRLPASATQDGGRASRTWRRARLGQQQPGVRPHQLPAVVPRQLPAVAPHFTGREAELAELDSVLEGAAGDGAAVVISAVGGMAGVGKTALAVRWAHRVSDRFPDGQLYVNLRGFGPAGELVDPAAAIRGLLDGLGVAAERIPVSTQAQAGLYRSLLAGRRMLLVLDNARDEDQVRPLLPGSGSCVVVVTSRTRLTGLAAAEGARLVSLDVLPAADARQVLAGRLGDGRVAAEPDAVEELAGLCGRLPLALAITAARAADRPGFPLAGLAAELAGGQRLGALDAGEAATSVQAVFWWSYQQLDAASARLFRLLGLHPGPGITADAAARLAGLPGGQARDLLRGLVRGCLLTEPHPGRYVFHDLLRAYAAGQAEAADSLADRRAARTRLFGYYLTAAEAAAKALGQSFVTGAPDPGARDFTGGDAAMAWLDAERANLTAVAADAGGSGWPGCTILLAAALFRYLDDGGHFTDAQAVHTAALDAARRAGDRAAQAGELRHCAADFRQGRYDQASGKLRQALEIYRGLGDRFGQGRTLGNLGHVLRRQGSYAESADHHQQALVLARALGDTFGEALALDGLGTTLCLRGHYQPAAEHHRQAIALCREIGESRTEGFALENLAVALVRQERWQEAAGCLDQALAMLRQARCRYSEADITNTFGAILAGQGHHQEAAEHHRQALTLYRELGDRSGEAGALNSLGEALTALGLPAQATSHHHDALTIAAEVSDRYQQARAHHGLARASTATGDTLQARRHGQHALALYTDLGCPEASQARTALQDLEADTTQHRPRTH
jgi:DNA-binding SARP family transcriptional activator/tetratricopeptide (TPR) repeat protein